MMQGKIIILIVVLAIGFGAGFMLRPVIAPPANPAIASGQPANSMQSREARGVQYFVANVDEARQIVQGCRDGSVRGAQCANAEEAIIKVEAEERRKHFLGN